MMRTERSRSEFHDATGEVIDDEIAKLEKELLVEKYKPKFLGYGGEHVVFNLPEHPAIVAKVHKYILSSIIEANLVEDSPIDTIPPSLQETFEQVRKEDLARNRTLEKYFKGTTLKERPYALKVPITRALVESMHEFDLAKQIPDGVHEAWAMVRIQERAPGEAFEIGALTTAFRYVEHDSIEGARLKEYEALNEHYLDGLEQDRAEVSAFFGSHMRGLAENMEEDVGLKDVVREFVERAIRYTQETGEMLDLAGPGNVTFFQEDGEWRCLLVDAKYPSSDAYEKSTQALQNLLEGAPQEVGAENRVLNLLNFARTINFLAEKSGSREFLQVADQSIAGRSEELITFIQSGP